MSNLLNTAKLAIEAQDNEFPVGCLVTMGEKVMAVIGTNKKGDLVLRDLEGYTMEIPAYSLRHATAEELASVGIEKVELGETPIKKGDFWALKEKPGRLRLVGDAVGKFPTDFPKSSFFRFCAKV